MSRSRLEHDERARTWPGKTRRRGAHAERAPPGGDRLSELGFVVHGGSFIRRNIQKASAAPMIALTARIPVSVLAPGWPIVAKATASIRNRAATSSRTTQ